MSKPRVLLADDHRILAEGLRGLLEPEFDLVDVVTDGRALVAAAKKSRPDVIVADISMPSLNGIEAAVQLREAGIPAKVVFLTMHTEVAYARRALEAGAAGFVLKHSAPAELVTAIREALQGHTYVTPLISGALLHSYQADRAGSGDRARARDRARGREAAPQLTGRQREVLQLFAEGRSAKEVASVLHISVRTAEFHKARLMEALGIQTTAELVQHALRNGIIST
jgi:DNA-binding NarL/FixJ family response regulator